MSVLRMDGFSQYDGDATQLLNSNAGWANQPSTASLEVGEGRDGGDALRIPHLTNDSGFNAGARIALPNAANEAWVHFAYQTPAYPAGSENQGLLHGWTVAGQAGPVFAIQVLPTGALDVRNGAGDSLGTTAAGVLTPGAKHAVCVHFVRHASTGAIQIWIDQVSKISLTGLALGATDVSLVTFCRNISGIGSPYSTDLMDVFINDETDDGAGNDGFMGDPRLVFLRARADYETEQGWTPQRRYMFGNGVLSLPLFGANPQAAIGVADASAVRVGAGDFTIETSVRFLALPSGSNKAVLFNKWLETGDVRSWQVFYGGPSLNSSHLELRVSTDGTAGTVTSPISVSWTPIIGRRYAVALQVEGNEATLYIDGVRQNAPVAFPTPANNTSVMAFGGEQDSAGPTFAANKSLYGYLDEIRFTKGVARYGSGYTVQTAAFPRNAIDDPDYSSVVLLAGFDNSIIDESAAPRTITAYHGAVRYAPDDAPPDNYKVIVNGNRPDTYIEAAFLPAVGIQTYTEQPANNDTVGADGETYTFKTTLTPTAGEVLIGATIDDTIDNIAAAMNGDAGSGTLYAAGTDPLTNASALNRGTGQLEVSANALGSAGNAIVVSSSNSDNPWTAATLTGGDDIPDPSEFVLDRLPAHTTGVLAAALIHRSKKTDSGDGNVQLSLVTNDDSSEPGDDQPLTTNFIFYSTIIVTDPATMGGLTPSSFINARVRVDRTQ